MLLVFNNNEGVLKLKMNNSKEKDSLKIDLVRQGILNSMASKGLELSAKKYFTSNQQCHIAVFKPNKVKSSIDAIKDNKEILIPIYHLVTTENKVIDDFIKISQSLEFTREYLTRGGEVVRELNGCGYIDYINGKSMSAHEELFFSNELYRQLRLL